MTLTRTPPPTGRAAPAATPPPISNPVAATPRARSEWAPLGILMVATFMIVLDFFIVNVALPSIQVGLHATTAQVEWVVAGYGLTLAVFLIAAGRIGDRIGRRRALGIGLAVFTATSALCGLAPDAGVLVAARLGQGLGAALMSPNVLSILGVVYPGEKRVKAITIYGMVMGLAAASGQVIGGLLIAANLAGSGWRAIFLINVPLGLAALGLLRHLVPESRADQAAKLDLRGMALITTALTALVLPLVEGHDAHWALWTWLSFAASAALFGAFVRTQRRPASGATPLLSPDIFRSTSLRSGLGTQAVFWCGQASFYLVLSLYLQDGRGLSPLHAGLLFTILAAAYLTTSLRAPALTARFGRDLVFVGALCVAGGDLALLAVAGNGSGPLALLVPGLVLAGAGQGLCITPLTTTVMSHCTPQQAGAISGALSTMQQVGNALGVAVTGAVFYGSLHAGVPTAFRRSLIELMALLVGVAVLTRLLPGRRNLSAGTTDA